MVLSTLVKPLIRPEDIRNHVLVNAIQVSKSPDAATHQPRPISGETQTKPVRSRGCAGWRGVEEYAPGGRSVADHTHRADDGARLALYHFEGCGYCYRVRDVIDELGIDVELRDIFDNREWFDELVEARGRRTVPVLRITAADGEERWLPESRDIIRYLRETYAPSAA
jgi:glutaredoxin